MSFQDPYSDPYYSQQQPRYGNTNNYNPYTGGHQAHPSYDQSGSGYDDYRTGYQGEGYASKAQSSSTPQRQATMRSFLTGDDERTRPAVDKDVPPLPNAGQARNSDQPSGFDGGEFQARDRTTYSDFKSYRTSYQGNLWAKGGRGACLCRVCCCTIMVTILLFVSILLTLALWVRPPAVTIHGVVPPATGNQFQVISNGVTINLGVSMTVTNPNYFSVGFSQIQAKMNYPIGNTPIGGGTAKNVNFPSHSSTNYTFPFSITYTTDIDPQKAILNDLKAKCGSGGSQVTIDYSITPGIRIILFTISPTVSNSLSFTCPLPESVLDALDQLTGLL